MGDAPMYGERCSEGYARVSSSSLYACIWNHRQGWRIFEAMPVEGSSDEVAAHRVKSGGESCEYGKMTTWAQTRLHDPSWTEQHVSLRPAKYSVKPVDQSDRARGKPLDPAKTRFVTCAGGLAR